MNEYQEYKADVEFCRKIQKKYSKTSYFATKLPGEWSYQIYEQTSTSNLIPSQATSMLESGQATLNDTSQFSFTTYSNQTNTYKVRDI